MLFFHHKIPVVSFTYDKKLLGGAARHVHYEFAENGERHVSVDWPETPHPGQTYSPVQRPQMRQQPLNVVFRNNIRNSGKNSLCQSL